MEKLELREKLEVMQSEVRGEREQSVMLVEHLNAKIQQLTIRREEMEREIEMEKGEKKKVQW